jgi:hypothetical protein
MASLACGRRLSLRNQYDTKTPRARVFFAALVKRTALSSGRIVARPARSRDMLASRKIVTAWVSKFPSKTFFEIKRFEKFPQGSRITAGLSLQRVMQSGNKVIFKRSTWARGPQAVLKDSCLDNTLLIPRGLEGPGLPVSRRRSLLSAAYS